MSTGDAHVVVQLVQHEVAGLQESFLLLVVVVVPVGELLVDLGLDLLSQPHKLVVRYVESVRRIMFSTLRESRTSGVPYIIVFFAIVEISTPHAGCCIS